MWSTEANVPGKTELKPHACVFVVACVALQRPTVNMCLPLLLGSPLIYTQCIYLKYIPMEPHWIVPQISVRSPSASTSLFSPRVVDATEHLVQD